MPECVQKQKSIFQMQLQNMDAKSAGIFTDTYFQCSFFDVKHIILVRDVTATCNHWSSLNCSGTHVCELVNHSGFDPYFLLNTIKNC